jgi:hypothetical protein
LVRGDVGGHDVEHLAAESSQLCRTELAGFGQQMGLGLRDQLGVQGVREGVEGPDDDACLLPGDLPGPGCMRHLWPSPTQHGAEAFVADRLTDLGAGLGG